MTFRILATATERGPVKGTNLKKHGFSFVIWPRKWPDQLLAQAKEQGLQPHLENQAREQIVAGLAKQGIKPGEPIDYPTKEVAEEWADRLRKKNPHIDYEVVESSIKAKH